MSLAVFFGIDQLEIFARDILNALTFQPDTSAAVASSLILADRLGVCTHGIGMLPLYTEMISAGAINPQALPSVEYTSGKNIKVDGQLAFGQLTGRKAVSLGVQTAREHGVAVVGIRNGSHLGRLGEWAQMATAAGMVFMALANTGGGAKNVAAHGGHERKLSTNPLAFGVPTFGVLPFDIIVDFASSQISGSVIRERYLAGAPLEDEWTTTDSGQPVSDAGAFMRGMGALLPLGGRLTGHKGYGLSVVAELLGGFAGGMVVGQENPDWFSNAALFTILDPTEFLPIHELEERVFAVSNHLRDDYVKLPGEGAFQRALAAKEQGIDVPQHVLDSLRVLSEEIGVPMVGQLNDIPVGSIDDRNKLKTW